MRVLRRAGGAAAVRRGIRFSSSGGRGRVRRCSSRSLQPLCGRGTTELPELITLARELRAQSESEDIGAYAEVLAGASYRGAAGARRALPGRTRVHRRTDRPHFIDKMPNDFLARAMIRLDLATRRSIIDARRHPLARCSVEFQAASTPVASQGFSYDLTDLGRYYRDYVGLMAHFDSLHGRDTLTACPTSAWSRDRNPRSVACSTIADCHSRPVCLRFFENERPVRTASSEQVRQPIFREGIEHWRHFDAVARSTQVGLGPGLDAYPVGPSPDRRSS